MKRFNFFTIIFNNYKQIIYYVIYENKKYMRIEKKKRTIMSFNIDDEDVEVMLKMAEDKNMNLSLVVRHMIKSYINRYLNNDKK